MAKKELSEQEVKEFREVFDLMDKDRGGTLSTDEVKQLMDMLGMKVRADELEQIMTEIDQDGSGEVDFEEFLQVMSRPSELPYTRQDVMRAFQMFVQPGDPSGHINAEHLEQMLVKYGSDKMAPDEIVRLVNSMEANGEGLIDFETKINMFVPR